MREVPSSALIAGSRALVVRLVGSWRLLLAVAAIIVVFVVAGGLRLDLAVAGYLVLAAVLTLWPRPDPTRTLAPSGARLSAEGQGSDLLPVFVEALDDPCVVLDSRGAVRHRNAAAARQYPNLLPGQVMTLVMRNPDLVSAIEQSQRSGEMSSVELHETLPAETWDRVLVSPLRRPGHDWLADDDRQLLVTFQSLTELKRVDAMRSDFIANASHELRTPLASLAGFIDTLRGPAARDSEAREKFLGIMRVQADRMSRLIDDLLSLSRIEMHQHVLPTGSVDLAALLREVREGLQIQAHAAGVEVVLSLPEGQVNVTGDRGQLYEVFENLIDNAIKYGGEGKAVEVELSPIDRQGLRHRVSVIDHGPGVEPEHVPRLTERFYRVDAETSRNKRGTGLGLAIVKHIVQRHRGQITIRSRPGEGLRVDVMLP